MTDTPSFLTQEEYYLLTTHLLHYIVYHHQTEDSQDPVDVFRHYMIQTEKPKELQSHFHAHQLSFAAFLLSFFLQEVPNASYYESVTPQPTVTLKKPPTEKMINYLLLLAKKRYYQLPPLELVSFDECRALIDQLK